MKISKQINWKKVDGLVPAVIQDATNLRVLMLGYMNQEALEHTLKSGHITFFSRTRQALWIKGETSGNYLELVSIELDCDADTLLAKARPKGPVCHTGNQTCFNNESLSGITFLSHLTKLIKSSNMERPSGSYVTKLFNKGPDKIAQKVGEEGVELALAKVKNDKHEILSEGADLMFHFLVLLESSNLSLDEVCAVLSDRHKNIQN